MERLPVSSETILLVAPEILLVLVGTALYIGGAFSNHRNGWGLLAAGGLVLAAIALFQQQSLLIVRAGSLEPVQPLNGPLVLDLFAQTLRWFVLGVGILFVMLSARLSSSTLPAEYMGSLLFIIAGLMIISLAGDLVLMFLGLELVSIPTYVLLYLGRNDAASQEATIKYFFLSILASALLLYGFSFLYGIGGSTQLADIHRAMSGPVGAGPVAVLAKLAVLLVVAGLGFRITIVPFHFYAPDVYQGTVHPNAGLLAVVPKIAGLTALLRIVAQAMPGMESLGWMLVVTLAILTMTLGNVLALWQQNIRRMMAYSSIAHAGYMLIGLAVGFAVKGGAEGRSEIDGMGAMMFYLLVYAIATAGTFAALTSLSDENHQVDRVDELAGLARTRPRTAAAIAIFMFSLTGLPLMAGFWGKFFLFTAALGIDPSGQALNVGPWRPFLVLAVVGVINAAISAAYYLRIVGAMYFRGAPDKLLPIGGHGAAWATLICAALVLGLGIWPDAAFNGANRATESGHSSFARAGITPPPDSVPPEQAAASGGPLRTAPLAAHRARSPR